mmetsp:Transcript_29432/g.62448  ORF Transcript_29432/g.62448 Transcript_29432/m.62448 type:complete len:335 (+) Transcript_29432:635-1639(+)
MHHQCLVGSSTSTSSSSTCWSCWSSSCCDPGGRRLIQGAAPVRREVDARAAQGTGNVGNIVVSDERAQHGLRVLCLGAKDKAVEHFPGELAGESARARFEILLPPATHLAALRQVALEAKIKHVQQRGLRALHCRHVPQRQESPESERLLLLLLVLPTAGAGIGLGRWLGGGDGGGLHGGGKVAPLPRFQERHGGAGREDFLELLRRQGPVSIPIKGPEHLREKRVPSLRQLVHLILRLLLALETAQRRGDDVFPQVQRVVVPKLPEDCPCGVHAAAGYEEGVQVHKAFQGDAATRIDAVRNLAAHHLAHPFQLLRLQRGVEAGGLEMVQLLVA